MSHYNEETLLQLEAQKSQNLGQLLIKTARLFQEATLAQINQHLGVSLRPSHMALFPHIDFQGTRLTTLANKVGISKQAVGQLVDDLVKFELLVRVPDPSDGRARLIQFSSKPGKRIEDGLGALADMETRFSGKVSPARLEMMRETLNMMIEVLEVRAPEEGES